MTTDLEALAKGLSKAQREDLLRLRSHTRTVFEALERKGLAQCGRSGVYLWELTPLGLALRAHLKEPS